jgi:catechol 2,3-dioxygenase-like lactoylglutathione lyase family enzyme
MHPVATRSVGCQRSAVSIAVEVNHIVIPARDKRASARLLAYILGLEVDADPDHFVRIHGNDGLTIEFSEPQGWWALQCAFLVGVAEFEAALSRIKRGTIDFYATFDGTGRGEINRLHGARSIYFDDPDGHLFELIEQTDVPAPGSRIKAVAIKLTNRSDRGYDRSTGNSR